MSCVVQCWRNAIEKFKMTFKSEDFGDLNTG